MPTPQIQSTLKVLSERTWSNLPPIPSEAHAMVHRSFFVEVLFHIRVKDENGRAGRAQRRLLGRGMLPSPLSAKIAAI
jgi:hypothetical protein